MMGDGESVLSYQSQRPDLRRRSPRYLVAWWLLFTGCVVLVSIILPALYLLIFDSFAK
jgi:hypothetical protein